MSAASLHTLEPSILILRYLNLSRLFESLISKKPAVALTRSAFCAGVLARPQLRLQRGFRVSVNKEGQLLISVGSKSRGAPQDSHDLPQVSAKSR